MNTRSRALPALTAAVALLAAATFFPGHGDAMPSQTTTTPVAEKDRWNLSELYATDAAWAQSKAAYEKKIDGNGGSSRPPRRVSRARCSTRSARSTS
jgi:hypothetical protein